MFAVIEAPVILLFQSLVKQISVVIAEDVPHQCSSRRIIWSILVINVKMNNFINDGGIFILYVLVWSKSKFSQIWCIKLYLQTLYLLVPSKYKAMENFWSNICKYTVISGLIFCIQIVCEFDFFNKLFSEHQWIVKIWNNCFLLLFLKLFPAHSLLETYVIIDDSDFPHTNCLRVSFFQQKVHTLYIVYWWLIP